MTGTGTDTDSGTLTVVGIPPELISGPSDLTVAEETTIDILCKVQGYPIPKHIWYKVNISDAFENSRSQEILARQSFLPRTRFSILENFQSIISRRSRFSKVTVRETKFIASLLKNRFIFFKNCNNFIVLTFLGQMLQF